jgi:hypothetical protein
MVPVTIAWPDLRLRMEERLPAANTLNKQPRTNDSLGGSGVGLQPFTIKNKFVTKNEIEPRSWTNSLDKRPKRRNMDMRFGLWNVRSLYRMGSLITVSREVSKYMLDLVGVQEVR